MNDGLEVHLLKMMLHDAFDSVKAIYGDEGLQKVIGHMGTANRAREHNAEIDEIARNFGRARNRRKG